MEDAGCACEGGVVGAGDRHVGLEQLDGAGPGAVHQAEVRDLRGVVGVAHARPDGVPGAHELQDDVRPDKTGATGHGDRAVGGADWRHLGLI